MTKTSKTVVFFGSGPVAAKSLSLLLKHTEVEAIITKPTTTREMAAAAPGVPVLEVTNAPELDELLQRNSFASRLGVLIDFGIIVHQSVINAFELGIVNSHFSLLPQWRGADPITFSILSGQKETGVSLMLLVEAMDEGPILACGVQPIDATTTTPDLTDQLIVLSDKLLKTELPKYLAEKATLLTQEDLADKYNLQPSYSRKLTKEDGIIDWHKPAEAIEREVRAFAGWPRSRTILADKDVIITSSHVVAKSGKPGTCEADRKELLVYCADKALSIDQLQPSGKKEMPIQAFLAGYGKLLRNN
jgi:methionyl-tRNA formyltransferase